MTRNKLALIMAVIIGVGAIAGGIVYAQEAAATAPLALLDDNDQEPANADKTFSILLAGGTFLGVGTEDISKENMGRYGMREVRGVGVTQVVKDSPAEKAGLKRDDVILRFDGESVTSARKLSRLVSESSPDQSVRITISRGGAEQEISATLSKQNMKNLMGAGIRDDVLKDIEKDWPQIKAGDGNFVFNFGANRRIGVSTQTLTRQLADYFGAKDGGLLITSVSENSPAANAGLRAGDVITAVDGEKVNSSGDIVRAINKKEDGEISLTILREHNSLNINLTPEKSKEPTIMRPGTIGNRRIVIPSVQVPAIPEMNIEIPRIVIPATPRIDVTVPGKAPRARTGSRVIII
ncbi:MAG TPA: PDZ domain-containing protein [Pyrinomonadaceae bacterium]|nr:PDZ domain-containing protein [Pyrinomonadaceae bacterium]